MLINEILSVNDIKDDNSPLNKMIGIEWRHGPKKYMEYHDAYISRSVALFYVENKYDDTEEIAVTFNYFGESPRNPEIGKSLTVSFEVFNPEGYGGYSLTNTGMASLKLGGVCRAIYEYLQNTPNDVETITFTAKEASRVSSYLAIAKRLIKHLFPSATIEQTRGDDQDTLFTIKIK